MSVHAMVVTLIADPAKEKLSRGLVSDVRKRIEAASAGVGEDWLADGEAIDFFFDLKDMKALKVGLKSLLADRPFDWAILPRYGRKKRLLISDMDSTMIGQECIDELADAIGIGEQVAAITERAMNGELDFKEALAHRVALLAGMDAGELERVYKERITPTPGAKTLVATMRKHGAFTLLVSGGFSYFTKRVADAIGFHGDMANTLEIVDNKLTGEVTPPILDKEAKLNTLNAACAQMKLEPSQTMAVGDGANDLPMLKAAGLSVGYRAKELVRKEVTAAINHTDLTSALYFQGYKKAEFVG